jgi:uncharacterized protein YkwD
MRPFVFKSFCRSWLVVMTSIITCRVLGADHQEIGDPASHSGTATGEIFRVIPKLNSPTTLFDHGDPTDFEQYLLELVNRARANPAAEAARLGIDLNKDLPSGTLSPEPKQPLAMHPQLLSAARAHSAWMLDQDVFSHTGANNSSPGARMSAAGYNFVYPGGWGENIAWRGTSAGAFSLKYYVELMHDGLFRSSGHRKNMMNPSFDEAGFGVETGYFLLDGDNWNSAMATEKFAYSSATPGPLVLGVVFRDENSNGSYDPGEGVEGVSVVPGVGNDYAVTSSSGGYAFPATTTGELIVEFSGGELAQPVTRSIMLGVENVKLDLELNSAIPLLISSDSLVGSVSEYEFTFSGPADLQVQVQRSTDFLNWSMVATYILGPDPVTFRDDDPPSGHATYRLFVP